MTYHFLKTEKNGVNETKSFDITFFIIYVYIYSMVPLFSLFYSVNILKASNNRDSVGYIYMTQAHRHCR